jgi:1-acyl-sn-glycerol-3-phosphate acyltransferase
VSALPLVGASVPRRGSRGLRRLGRAGLALMRWRVEGDVPDLSKFVVAVAPHTSNWDFVVGVSAMFALDLRISFLGKHTLFRWPLSSFMRWIGGIPVDRSSRHGVVGDAVGAFERVEQRVLAIAPEGTRKPVERFRSGFLHIARGARVPVLLATLDWEKRCVRFGPLLEPSPDLDRDLRDVEAFFAGVRGRNQK